MFFKMDFCSRWGWLYFDFLGDYFVLRGLFIFLFFSLFCGSTLLMFV